LDPDKTYSLATEGDHLAERRLFEWLRVRFRVFARHSIWDESDVDDVVQNALAAVFTKYKEVVIRQSFSAWAHGVLNKEILRYTRDRSRGANVFASGEPGSESHAGGSGNPEVQTRLLMCLEKVASVNLRYASVLRMKYEGLDTESICRRLNITPNNLYVLLSRARAMLKECLSKRTIEP
jgi:RNA polymerase sigma-70 factor (ECF subfamily)